MYSVPVFAQQTSSCGSDRVQQLLLQEHPELMDAYQQDLERQRSGGNLFHRDVASNFVETIPVVVHIMEPLSRTISDEDIYRMMSILNDGFRNTEGNGVDVGIQFVLARQDPQGMATTGIVRVDASGVSNYIASGLVTDDQTNGNHSSLVGLSNWDHQRYYNIWIVRDLGNSAGFAYLPLSVNFDKDGTVLDENYIHSSTVPHELGHALGLYHTFEDGTSTNCPGQGASGDFVSDTDPHMDQVLSCTDRAVTNPCTNNPYGALVDNFMAYLNISSCRKVFTQGQSDRANQQLLNSTRNSLRSSIALQTVQAPVVNFSANRKLVAAGSSVRFMDLTRNGANNLEWTFEGGLPSSSTDRNPTVVYNQAGQYRVSLRAANTQGVDTLVREAYIQILAASQVAPPSCQPAWPASNNYGIGPIYFGLSEMASHTSNTSTDILLGIANSNGFVDRSSTHIAQLSVGQEHEAFVTVGPTNSEKVLLFIDYNDNGTFEQQEEVGRLTDKLNGPHSIRFTVPANAMTEQHLRMRVISGYNLENVGACNPFSGQAEDYGVYIMPATVIEQQPQASTFCEQSEGQLTVQTSQDADYQWFLNGNALVNGQDYDGVDSSTLVIRAARGQNIGNYHVRVTGIGNQILYSDTVLVNIDGMPSLVAHPVDQEVVEGDSVRFEAVPSPIAVYDYQWYQATDNQASFSEMSSQTGETLSFRTEMVHTQNMYFVRMSSGVCRRNSDTVRLTVHRRMGIASHPVDARVCEDGQAVLEAQADHVETYQWYFNGQALVESPLYQGVQTSRLIVQDSAATAAGEYYIKLRGVVGQLLHSDTVNISVTAFPEISRQVTNFSALPGDNVRFDVGVSNLNQAMNFQWFRRLSGEQSFAAIQGEESNSLDFVLNPDLMLSQYFVKIAHEGCAVYSDTVNLSTYSVLEIQQQPVSQRVCDNSSVSITVSAENASAYQWHRNGRVLENDSVYQGAQSNTLRINRATPNTVGGYTVRVDGENNQSVVSQSAVLTVLPYPEISLQPVDVQAEDSTEVFYRVMVGNSQPTFRYQWYKQLPIGPVFEPISDADSTVLMFQAHLGLQGSRYFVKVFNEECYVRSDTASLQVVRMLSANSASGDVQLMPNPVQDQLLIKGVAQAKLKIYTLAGHLEMEQVLDSPQQWHSVDLSQLRQGIYVLHLVEQTRTRFFRLSVE